MKDDGNVLSAEPRMEREVVGLSARNKVFGPESAARGQPRNCDQGNILIQTLSVILLTAVNRKNVSSL